MFFIFIFIFLEMRFTMLYLPYNTYTVCIFGRYIGIDIPIQRSCNVGRDRCMYEVNKSCPRAVLLMEFNFNGGKRTYTSGD